MNGTSGKKMSAEEKKWRADNDASTLIQAESVKSNKERYKMAMASINQIKKNKEQEVAVINKLTSKNYYLGKKS